MQMNSLWTFRGTDGGRARAVSPPLGAIYGAIRFREEMVIVVGRHSVLGPSAIPRYRKERSS